MDELNNLIRIEQLCRNLQQQQERQRNQHSPPIVTPTGWFLLYIYLNLTNLTVNYPQR